MTDNERRMDSDDRDDAIGEAGPDGGGYNNPGGAGRSQTGDDAAVPNRTPAGHVSGAQDEGSLEADRKGD